MKKVADTSAEQWLGGLERLLNDPEEEQLPVDARLPWAELERLTRGELGEERRAALEAHSGADPALRRALDAHRPLTPALLERISDGVLQGGGVRSAPSPAASSQPAPSATRRRGASTRARLAWALTPALTAAAVLLLLLQSPTLVPLGDYSVEVAGGVAASRGDTPSPAPASSLQVVPGGRLQLVLRPALPDAEAALAHVFLEHSGERRTLGAPTQRSESGALRLALELPPFETGTELLVVVARPAAELPDIAAARAGSGPGWSAFRFTLRRPAQP
jgi:hypothetical protein